jgi:hypothetical protein
MHARRRARTHTRHQSVVYTERVRFLPPDNTAGAAAHTAPLRYALKNAQEMDDAFAQVRSRCRALHQGDS